MKVYHTLKPIYNCNSKILILGSMPSIKSRKELFYYAHPQNRFWQIISILFDVNFKNNNDKKEFLLYKNIALWDVFYSCDINKSSDSTIKNVTVNNLDIIIKEANIKCIFCTGKTAYKYYCEYFSYNIPVILLPSPSSANAKYKLNSLIKNYSVIKKYL